MNHANESRIRKVRKFGRIARGACSAILGFTVLLAAPWGFLNIIAPSANQAFDLDLGLVRFSGEHLESIALRGWLILIVTIELGLFLGMLWLIRRMFDNLSRGDIYTRGNVDLLRSLGRLLLAGACLRLVIPAASLVLMETQVISATAPTHFTFSLSPDVLSAFAMAAIVMLVSWVTDIGLGVREEADELRRDAELVV